MPVIVEVQVKKNGVAAVSIDGDDPVVLGDRQVGLRRDAVGVGRRVVARVGVGHPGRGRDRGGTDQWADDEVLVRAVEDAWRDDDYTVDAEAVLLRAETRDELYDALVRLPVHYRSAVVLHDVEGLTSSEVAEVQQISLPAAKQRLRRGRTMLVSALAGGVERREATKGVPMTCWSARSRIDDYLAGELSLADRTMVEQHLAGCPTCPALYASIVGVTSALGGWRDPDSVVPARLAEQVRARLASP